MNISEKMQELIASLDIGSFNGVDIEPLLPECEDEWCEDYAVAHGLYFSPIWDDEYFDEDKFTDDLMGYVRDHFGSNAVLIDSNGADDTLSDDQVVIRFNKHCGEVEVYRMRHVRRIKDA